MVAIFLARVFAQQLFCPAQRKPGRKSRSRSRPFLLPYSSRLQRAFLLSPPPQRQAAAPVPRGGLFIKPKGSKQKPPHSRAVAFVWKILPVFPGGAPQACRCVAARAESRDGRYRRPGNYQDANSLARGPWPDWPSRPLAFGKGGKDTGKLVARTCVIAPYKRGASRRSKARIDSGGTPPRTCVSVLHKRGPQPPLQGAN